MNVYGRQVMNEGEKEAKETRQLHRNLSLFSKPIFYKQLFYKSYEV